LRILWTKKGLEIVSVVKEEDDDGSRLIGVVARFTYLKN
jgi:hypothetical protein